MCTSAVAYRTVYPKSYVYGVGYTYGINFLFTLMVIPLFFSRVYGTAYALYFSSIFDVNGQRQ